MDWVRGAAIGRGSSAAVHIAFNRSFPSTTFAVKSSAHSSSSLLRHEADVLAKLQGCNQIIGFFGHDITSDPAGSGIDLTYNVFLEYADGGTISDAIQRAGGRLPELTIRRYLCSILLGLRHIHDMGYVHCDIKPQNILIAGEEARIADFGLAKRAAEESHVEIRGTPMYLAPESAARNEYEAAADIWALGCTVSEMVSGLPPWRDAEDSENGVWALMFRLGFSEELPEIPPEMSEEGKDFLRRCFVKEPSSRWSAEMLLSHPFVASTSELELEEEAMACSVSSTSPRSVLGYSFANPIPPSPPTTSEMPDSFQLGFAEEGVLRVTIGGLTSEERPDWTSASPEEEEAMACSVSYTFPRSVLGHSFANSIPLSPPRTSEMPDSFQLAFAEEEVRERIRGLASEEQPDWTRTSPEEDEGWLTVR
ncbi:mitogen-activated protein kinase kinase kinase 18-like [Dendrobium catenatum]|uniref:Mitogen-activated protein kinase kinase kinase YODA n=1 Tax=Dendrobium catenatum TaxID=906689 RepID=A0A2I0VG24_9ASPA|nr:mitogen-activated protein kinase kinase kinase 18-like [Dendrobium catenatum]PKU62366.1 Mitogen-activated protein kinase kinase kinase YODA [Dendrobium catenatum]